MSISLMQFQIVSKKRIVIGQNEKNKKMKKMKKIKKMKKMKKIKK